VNVTDIHGIIIVPYNTVDVESVYKLIIEPVILSVEATALPATPDSGGAGV
jgi:endonuclease V-like protein UPF0215 family